jgi:hypothetical protein
MLGMVTRQKFQRGPSKKYHIQVWSNLTNFILHEKKTKIKKLREDCCLTPHESAISWPE